MMIHATDLTKSYGSFRALDKVTFDVEKGEIVGFLGPNGAGKSTTMRILTCFLAPSAGTAKINGHDIFDDPLSVRRSLGYLPQRAPLYPEMSVLEYLRFSADLRQLDDGTFKKNARNVVEVCGLAQVLGKVIRTLSHGYRQRVGLAQALIHDPPILILDEPTSDLDPNEKAEFLEYLKQIGQDRTVLLSTHNLSEVESACARAIIVRKGRVVADGPLDEIRAKSGKVRYVVTIQESPSGAYKGTGAPPTQAQVEEALRSIPGVDTIKELPTDERAHSYALTADQKLDLRGDIFALVAGKGWVLLELVREIQTLENVFRNLTIGDELRNRHVSTGEEEEEQAEDEDEDEDEEEDEDEDEDEEDDDAEDEDEDEEGDDAEDEDEDEDEEDERKK